MLFLSQKDTHEQQRTASKSRYENVHMPRLSSQLSSRYKQRRIHNTNV